MLIELPADWTPTQISGFADWWEAKLSGDTAQRQRGMFVPHGANPVNLKEQALKDDYDEWLARVVMYCFSLPPTPYVRNHSKANDEIQQQTAEDEGLIPTLNWWADFWNVIIHRYLGEEEIDFGYRSRRELDAQIKAQSDDLGIRNGSKSIDEVRLSNGEEAVGIGLGIVTATGFVPLTDAAMKPTIYDMSAQKLTKSLMSPLPRERKQVKDKISKLQKKLAAWLAAIGVVISEDVGNAYDEITATYGGEKNTAAIVASEVTQGIEVPASEKLVEAIEEDLSTIARDGAVAALKQVGVEADVTEAAVEYAKARANHSS